MSTADDADASICPNRAVPDKRDVPASTTGMGEKQGSPRRGGTSGGDRDHGGPECPGPAGAGPRQPHDRAGLSPPCHSPRARRHRSAVDIMRRDRPCQQCYRRSRPRRGVTAQDRGLVRKITGAACAGRGAAAGRTPCSTDTPATSAAMRQMATEARGPARGNAIRGRDGQSTATGNPGSESPSAALHDPPELTARVPEICYIASAAQRSHKR